MTERADVDVTIDAAFTPLDVEAARSIARQRYGLSVETASRFETERDDTFGLTTRNGVVVLKVANPADDPGVVAMQCEALAHVARTDPGVPVPRAIPDLDGGLYSLVSGADGEDRVVRLLTYLPGRTLDYPATTPTQRESVGRTVGRLSSAMAGFEHPRADRVLAWDLQRAAGLRPYAECIADHRARDLAVAELDRFDAVTGPGLATVRRQVLHNDANEGNLVVDSEGHVSGILDFGDMVRTAVVADLAVAMAYAVGADGAVRDHSIDPWRAPYDLVRGYLAARALTPDEQELLPHLVRTRLAQRLLVNSWLATRNPAIAPRTARWVVEAGHALDRLLAAGLPTPTRGA